MKTPPFAQSDSYADQRCDCGHFRVQHGESFAAFDYARAGCWWCTCTEDWEGWT